MKKTLFILLGFALILVPVLVVKAQTTPTSKCSPIYWIGMVTGMNEDGSLVPIYKGSGQGSPVYIDQSKGASVCDITGKTSATGSPVFDISLGGGSGSGIKIVSGKTSIGYRGYTYQCGKETAQASSTIGACRKLSSLLVEARTNCRSDSKQLTKFSAVRACPILKVSPTSEPNPNIGKLPATCLSLYKDGVEWGYDTSDKTTGGQVSKLQRFFVAYFKLQDWPLNFNIGGPYGYFGPKTLANLKYFQGNVGGLTVTGIVDGPTMAKIAEISKCGVLSVDFRTPVAGTTIVKGVPFNITINSQNLPAGTKVDLWLVSSTSVMTNIAVGLNIVSPEFSYGWAMPNVSTILPGGRYMLKAKVYIDNGLHAPPQLLAEDETGYLIVVNPGLDFTAPLPGATIIKGVPFFIGVTAQNLPADARIDLKMVNPANNASVVFADSQPITSGQNYVLNPTQYYVINPTLPLSNTWAPGGGYKILASITDSYGNSLFSDETGYLIVANPTVDFTAPAAGATILRGVPFNITVASQNLPTGAEINLTLVSSTTAQTTIVTGQPISSPTFTYSWTVPATSGNYPVLPGGGYKIKGDITDANGSPLFTDEVGYLILASTTL